MTGPEPDSFHRSACNRCGVDGLVTFRDTQIEHRPWRLVWRCEVCGETAVRALPRKLAPTLVLMMEFPGGSRVSRREVSVAERMDLELFDELLRNEILSEA